MKFIKTAIFIFTLAHFVVETTYGIQPNDGEVTNGVYHSRFFEFSIPLPKGALIATGPQNTNLVKLGAQYFGGSSLEFKKELEAATTNSCVLVTASKSALDMQGEFHWAINISAENLLSHPEVRNGADCLRSLKYLFVLSGKPCTFTNTATPVMVGGVAFYELIVKEDSPPLPVFYRFLVTVRQDYILLIGITTLAPSDFSVLNGSLAKMTFVPMFAEDYLYRGHLEQTNGNLGAALADCNKAVALKPYWARAYNYRGILRRDIDDFDGALADYNKAIELKPAFAAPFSNRGHVLHFKKDYEGALSNFNRAIELLPNDVWPYRYRGFLYYDLHSFTNALTDFHKACELDPKGQQYSFFFIWLIRARLGDKEAATAELENYWNKRRNGKADDWPSKVARFLTGKLSEAGLFKAAGNREKKKDVEQHCEAYFYAGSKRLIENDKTSAMDYFEKCVATNVKRFSEYQSAVAEYNFLKAEK